MKSPKYMQFQGKGGEIYGTYQSDKWNDRQEARMKIEINTLTSV